MRSPGCLCGSPPQCPAFPTWAGQGSFTPCPAARSERCLASPAWQQARRCQSAPTKGMWALQTSRPPAQWHAPRSNLSYSCVRRRAVPHLMKAGAIPRVSLRLPIFASSSCFCFWGFNSLTSADKVRRSASPTRALLQASPLSHNALHSMSPTRHLLQLRPRHQCRALREPRTILFIFPLYISPSALRELGSTTPSVARPAVCYEPTILFPRPSPRRSIMSKLRPVYLPNPPSMFSAMSTSRPCHSPIK